MNSRLKNIQRTFVVSIISLGILSVVGLGLVLSATSAINLREQVSPLELNNLTENYPEVSAYLETQKHAEQHFITIANLIKSDQQSLILRALLFTGIPMLILSSVLGYIVARQLLEPVEKTFESQEQFLQDASHEMRNPLAALSAVAQEAKLATRAEDQKRAINSLDRQVSQLIKLNEDLLTLERAKTSDRSSERINASELLQDIIDSITPQATLQKIKIVSKITPDAYVQLSSKDFICVARNLIDNAVKYSSAKSSISVHLSVSKSNVTLSVQDKGIGIPAAQLTNIGQRFFRGSNVGRTSGTGLGMAIVNQIADTHGLQIAIDSVLGKGTDVTIQFPSR